MPAMNNQIEAATNAPSRRMLSDHRGMCLPRRIKAIFWWCYMHTGHPLPPAQILTVMPADTQIDTACRKASHAHQAIGIIPTWVDLHHHTLYRNTGTNPEQHIFSYYPSFLSARMRRVGDVQIQ